MLSLRLMRVVLCSARLQIFFSLLKQTQSVYFSKIFTGKPLAQRDTASTPVRETTFVLQDDVVPP